MMVVVQWVSGMELFLIVQVKCVFNTVKYSHVYR